MSAILDLAKALSLEFGRMLVDVLGTVVIMEAKNWLFQYHFVLETLQSHLVLAAAVGGNIGLLGVFWLAML